MTARDIALGTRQRSLIEIDLLDGEACEDNPRFDLCAVSEHYSSTGRLLLVPGVVDALSDIAEGYDVGEDLDGMRRASMRLWERAREVMR